jgi:hypothetical protein
MGKVEEKKLEQEQKTLKNLLNSSNDSVRMLSEKNDELFMENQKLKKLNKNAEQNVINQKKIVIDNLQQSAEKEKDLVNEILELREKIKILESKLEESEK